MKMLATLALLTALVSCGRCGTDQDAGTEPAVAAEGEPVATDVPVPAAVYKQAYERARDQISAESASDRLDALEHEIDREAEAAR